MSRIQVVYEGQLRTKCIHEETGDVVLTDAPRDNNGNGERISPTDLLAAALGSCTATLMGIAAQRLKVEVTGLRLTVEKEMVNAPLRRIGRLLVNVYCPHRFSAEITQKLEEAGRFCPVHQSLHPDVIQTFIFHWGSP